jgi:hypothetical protein
MAQSDVKPNPSYRGWLAVVIILGVLLVVGVVALITAAVFRARAIRATTAAGQSYTASVIAPGEKVEGAVLDGNRILLTLSGPRGAELVILDAGSGKILGRITVRP